MAAQQPVRPETRDLLVGVGLDVIGKRHFQPTPRFAVDLDGGDFLAGESGLPRYGVFSYVQRASPPKWAR
jgi:hypothetical protein